MASISIDSFQPFPAVTGYSTTDTELRVWYSRSFVDSTGISVQGGNGVTGFYITAACTVTTTISIASFSLRTTLDAQDPAPSTIQVFARLFSNNQPKAWVFAGNSTPNGWVIPNPTPAVSMTYEELAIYNQATVLANPPQTFWTAAQVQAYFNALSPASDASDVTKGITKLSVAPAVAANPIAYGQNDPAVATSTTVSTNLSASTSRATSNSVNISVADSKAVSDSVTTSTADSKGVSAGLAASTADSKAVSDSITTSTADSKGTSAGTRASTADSKALSVSTLTSTAQSGVTSNSANISVANSLATSQATSNSVLISGNTSRATSNSVLTSTAQSGVVSGSTGLSTLTSRVSSKGG